ncbi:hypothetical protein SH2C18_38710 [Clostridium sediminicola]|uniref:PucR family transcriptional regulator n=1 Tax=Clostridium sediminicola TaxID=3114879 RepID=UPI0031F1FFF0
MSISINELLQLETFKNFKLISGTKGLNNTVNHVGILDHETIEMIEKSFAEGEFIISTLLLIKDEIEKLYEYVEKLIEVNASGLAIKNIYFHDLPKEVIALANSKSFPIFIFGNIYFEDLITCVTNAIEDKNDIQSLALKVDNILYKNLNNVIIKKIAYEINRNFSEKNIVIFCERKNKKISFEEKYASIEKQKSLSQLDKIIPYNDGYLIITTYDNINNTEVEKIILNILEILGFNSLEYIIGVSSLYENLDHLNFSINESLHAYKHSLAYKKNISFFNKIGTNKILIPLIDNIWVKKYHDEMILPLLIYDKKNDTQLLKTAIKYIENKGDIKATSIDLFQHNNTIRYRIDKIHKILNKNTNINDFYEELSIAIKIYNLISISL